MLRMGLHLGDVIYRDNDVFGDGINIASLIEPLADPGGICVSEDVAHQVRNKIEFDLAEVVDKPQLKNIQRPIQVFRVMLPWMGHPSIPAELATEVPGAVAGIQRLFRRCDG